MAVIDEGLSQILGLVAQVYHRLLRDNSFFHTEAVRHRTGNHVSHNDFHGDGVHTSANLLGV